MHFKLAALPVALALAATLVSAQQIDERDFDVSDPSVWAEKRDVQLEARRLGAHITAPIMAKISRNNLFRKIFGKFLKRDGFLEELESHLSSRGLTLEDFIARAVDDDDDDDDADRRDFITRDVELQERLFKMPGPGGGHGKSSFLSTKVGPAFKHILSKLHGRDELESHLSSRGLTLEDFIARAVDDDDDDADADRRDFFLEALDARDDGHFGGPHGGHDGFHGGPHGGHDGFHGGPHGGFHGDPHGGFRGGRHGGPGGFRGRDYDADLLGF